MIQAAGVKFNQKDKVENILGENPFLIKTLIVNDCGMSDEIFSMLLEGIEAQSYIKSIHYINGELGPKSTSILKKIYAREKSDLQV